MTVTHPATVRVLPAPRLEPPTDEELAAAGIEPPPPNAELLPLPLPARAPANERRRSARRSPGVPRPPRPMRPIDPGAAVAAERPAERAADPGAGTPGSSGPAGSPEGADPPDPSPARLGTRRFLGTCLEVIGGFRPVTHLRPFCVPGAYAKVAARLTSPAAAAPGARWRGFGHGAARGVARMRNAAPPKAGRGNQTGPGDRITVRRVQICDIRGDAAEVAVVLARRDQVWAMALRLECVQGRWLCSDLEVL